ncbi:DUF3224 domain-containing protein [Streptomyces sp. NPDC057486]|uniref:DUF3224 domain-containing protein n=1 Tax=Streptomyces sp. NPDC057486 TaxID=3346145 RepID=UPI0036BAAE4E
MTTTLSMEAQLTAKAAGSYEITSWDEKPYAEGPDTPKLTKAHFTNAFSGDIEGEGAAETLMVYPTDSTANFVGLQTVTGTVGGRKGSFVLQATGSWLDGVARAEWFVVPGSATGGLVGLTGKGGYTSQPDGSCAVTLDYDFEE